MRTSKVLRIHDGALANAVRALSKTAIRHPTALPQRPPHVASICVDFALLTLPPRTLAY
jgi:hypothetical protein